MEQNHNQQLIPIATTPLGIQLSGSLTTYQSKPVQHYTLSYKNGLMPPPTAHHLATLITALNPPPRKSKLITGQQQGIYHLLIENQH